ncbi:hypothetical protein chiPu_0017717 [Chiloscyllium punctatum]|uniref:Uncharacterized protein n=1 Tax=Chiloscyllium punctatum TaxID=137246 RepID=A0A401RIB1_CHIPU|nr:hypothetical protein [Chiloscyllium punctatum]
MTDEWKIPCMTKISCSPVCSTLDQVKEGRQKLGGADRVRIGAKINKEAKEMRKSDNDGWSLRTECCAVVSGADKMNLYEIKLSLFHFAKCDGSFVCDRKTDSAEGTIL